MAFSGFSYEVIGLQPGFDYNAPMYLEYFGLLESPFSIAPDPRYLYMSERHREALAHLLYGLDADGAFILLTGDVGTGKTTVSRCLLEQVPENTNLALVLNPKLSSLELLQVICDELRVDYDKNDLSIKALVDGINRHLLEAHAQGRKTVVLIEEAQNLDLDVLEQLRLLTNLETNERKLLQVILLGQPEFLDVLDRPELSQLAQRVTARFHLTPLSLHEVAEYIGHRLAIAGCRRPLFAPGVLKLLYQYSGGVPRLINVMCDRALLGCYVQNRPQVDKKTLHNAAKEVLGENKSLEIRSPRSQLVSRPLAWVLALSLAAIAVFLYVNPLHQQVSQLFGYAVENQQSAESKNQLTNKPVSVFESVISEPVDAQPAFIQWPSSDQHLRSNLGAYQALFEKWQLPYDHQTHGTPCFYAKTQGLSCFHEQSDVNGLRALNRPAVLKLYDDFNQAQYVSLLRLDMNTATIYIGDKQQTISLQQLNVYWKGEFTLLWKHPPGYERPIRPGKSGETVVWLSQMMNALSNTPNEAEHTYYDTALVKRVKAFQLQQGLDSDGIVGVKTLIKINQILNKNIPLLVAG